MKKKPLLRAVKAQWQLVVMSVPLMLLVMVFSYFPLWGWSYAFFEASQQTMRPNFEKFLGLGMFTKVFSTPKFWATFRNSICISLMRLVVSYVCSISFAVMINEIRVKWFKKTVQTVSYLPHFLSWVVAVSMISVALSPDGGIVNMVLVGLGVVDKPVNWLMQNSPTLWVVMVLSDLWKEIGWSSIIYLAAMAGIDQEYYEAAQIDGAGRLRRIMAITIPSIMPTIRLLLILSIGSILSVGFEQYLLMQKPFTLDYSEVIETLVYHTVWASKNPGRMYKDIPYATAIGIMNSVISFVLVVSANKVSSWIDGERLF